MKNLTKNSVANVAKVGVASALIGDGLFLSACGDSGDSKIESFFKQRYPDAKILSFSEIQKEFGLKNKDCLSGKKGTTLITTRFIKSSDGEISVIQAQSKDYKDSGVMIKDTLTVDEFKKKNPECF